MSDKPIPKSLHTVTVLVRVARNIMETSSFMPCEAVDHVMEVLDLADKPDTHNLRAAALKQLEG